MFRKPKQFREQEQQDKTGKITFLHKFITWGMIAFILYFYFTDFRTSQIMKEEAEKQALSDDIRVINLITKQVLAIDPDKPGKVLIEIDKKDLLALPDGKNAIIEIEVPEVKAEAKEAKEAEKPVEKPAESK